MYFFFFGVIYVGIFFRFDKQPKKEKKTKTELLFFEI